mmetsp:Transcript_34895/g.70516  ORF Transcript_34895/g.70516 Transcript_34895/m.70516 type:complete len:136 (-) Transcript_34895:7-414(-)
MHRQQALQVASLPALVVEVLQATRFSWPCQPMIWVQVAVCSAHLVDFCFLSALEEAVWQRLPRTEALFGLVELARGPEEQRLAAQREQQEQAAQRSCSGGLVDLHAGCEVWRIVVAARDIGDHLLDLAIALGEQP